MNSKIFGLMLAFLISPLCIAKNDVRIHYRCHLSLLDKSEVVHHFISTGKKQTEFEAALPGQMVYFSDGVTGSVIENVYQCVKTDEVFKTKAARELEAKTPF